MRGSITVLQRLRRVTIFQSLQMDQVIMKADGTRNHLEGGSIEALNEASMQLWGSCKI